MDSDNLPADIDAEYGRAIGVVHWQDKASEGPICFPCHEATYTNQGYEPLETYYVYDTEPGANRVRCGQCQRPLYEVGEEWYRTHDRAPEDLL